MPDDVADAPKKAAKGIKGTLTKKIGPLPVWGWAGIGGGILVLFIVMRKRGGGSATQGGISTIAQPDVGGGLGGGGGDSGAMPDITGPANNPPSATIPSGETVTAITPTKSSVDNRPPAVKLPTSATITAPTPEEIAYAINKRDASTGTEQSQWNEVTQEHTQRLAASLNQTSQGRQQLSNVTTAYKKDPKAAQTFFEQCAKNPAGCKAMFG